MNTRISVRFWFFGAILVLVVWSNVSPARAAIITNVEVGDIFFAPTSVTIHTGDKVRWFWTGSIQHSTTSNSGLWNSGLKGNGGTFTNTFNNKGSFPYHCSIHGFQTGTVIVQASVGSPPIVTIISPTNDANFQAPANFELAATATDSDGTVTNVEFFQGTASLGHVDQSPFSVPINNLSAGNYTFSAVAADNSGLKATNSVNVVVSTIQSNAPPTIAILSPTNGATFSAPWSGTIDAAASDVDGTVTKVEFFADGNSLGTVTNPSSQISFSVSNLAVGSHVLTASATDNGGAVTTSAAVTIQVITPVGVTLSAPVYSSTTGFQFSYAAEPGVNYVVFRSVDLSSWLPISTNLATSNLVFFQDSLTISNQGYYRVGVPTGP